MHTEHGESHATHDLTFTGERYIPGLSETRLDVEHTERYHFAGRYVRGKHVLDIACGSGYGAPLLLNAGAASYHGVDIDHETVDHAQRTYKATGATFCVGDITTFSSDRVYDVITFFETIEHIKNYKGAIINLFKLLNEGGYLLISTPNRPITSPKCRSIRDSPANPYHVQEFTRDEFLSLLDAGGFSIDASQIYGQRFRRVPTNRLLAHAFKTRVLRALCYKIFGNPDHISCPKVTRNDTQEPRYIIAVAGKK